MSTRATALAALLLAGACGGKVVSSGPPDAMGSAPDAGNFAGNPPPGVISDPGMPIGGARDASASPGAGCSASSVAAPSPYALWVCPQRVCAAQIAACAAECACNDPVAQALACSAGGTTPSAVMACFTTAVTPIAADPVVQSLITCLQTSAGPCAAPTGADAGGG